MTAVYAHTWRVRIHGQQRVIGAGTLVADRTVLTCAHVVARALGADMRGPAPAGAVAVDFPGSESRDPTKAAVAAGGWVPVDAPDGGDLALLELAEAPPADVHPATLRACGDPAGRPVKAYGHPTGLDAGTWATARLIGHGGPGRGWVQFHGDLTGRAVTGGHSGAGVVTEAGEVIGMVVAEDRQPSVRVAWMIPMEICASKLPGLVVPSTGPAPPSSVPVADLQRLARALAEVPVMRNPESRQLVVDELRFAGSVRRHGDRNLDVFSLVRTCLDHDGGLTELMSVVRGFEGESMPVRHVDDLIAEMGLDGA